MKNNIQKSFPLLRMENIKKTFPGVIALDNVDISLHSGESLALIGENGAGKSTLMKILGGLITPDSGRITINDEGVNLLSPKDAHKMGISIIHQEINLIQELTIRENLFLGREKSNFGVIDKYYEKENAKTIFDKMEIKLDFEVPCSTLSIAEQQMVEIAKALLVNAKIIVMDEPTATLSSKEVGKLFKIIRDLKKKSIGIIYISHRLDEVFEICDRLMIIRDGKNIGEELPNNSKRDIIIEKMVGRPVTSEFPQINIAPGKESMRMENISVGKTVVDINFSLKEGEVLGFSGLVGAGRTNLMEVIFGLKKPDSGRMFINNSEIKIDSPREAIRNGISFITEDRKKYGLILKHSCQENFELPNLKKFSSFYFLNKKRGQNAFNLFHDDLKIKIRNSNEIVSNLSGGNQQKIVLAKWLESNSDIIIFDEPTRGIDVGAKYEIYQIIKKLAMQGKSIILVSSEMQEILGMCNRIIVMHEGRIKGEVDNAKEIKQEDILKMAIA